ncbi:hypothetical protein TNCV_2084531 [Trichonephila clavipes]|uniref:Uncharacterized protein n=1 Tax=Trichonephila clavipes TaxID=2585209 RepID=A0A8X6RJ01_TRICX|nr:hypothetical protein TNCV_2084531 [Trichonephila clavipes]
MPCLGTKRDRDKRRKWESLATKRERLAEIIVSNQVLWITFSRRGKLDFFKLIVLFKRWHLVREVSRWMVDSL